MLRVTQNNVTQNVVLEFEGDSQIKKVLNDVKSYMTYTKRIDEGVSITNSNVVLPIEVFLATWNKILEITDAYDIPSDNIQIEDTVADFLKQSDVSHEINECDDIYTIDNIQEKLLAKGFVRDLTPQQKRNVIELCKRNRGASFSVPGAGKSTEALAFYALKSNSQSRLFIICPLSTFKPWDEQIQECFGEKFQFLRFEKSKDLNKYISQAPQFAICNYDKVLRNCIKISHFLKIKAENTFVFLDESHKIMSQGKIAKAILSLSHIPAYKLILSGTPLPQCNANLVPQMNFLYPLERLNEMNVVSFCQGKFVRTTKKELGLPPEVVTIKQIEMSPVQDEAWKLIKGTVINKLKPLLEKYKISKGIEQKIALREMGKYVLILIRMASRPQGMLEKFIELDVPELVHEFKTTEPRSNKYLAVISRAKQLVKEGKKVVIWSIFRSNVEALCNDLREFGAKYIHGGVDFETRESNINSFKEDSNCMILIANPAASSEGISLHKVCQNAIYLDRGFNAAQFLQSKDRINRIGMPEGTFANIEIFESKATIDQRVEDLLYDKIENMENALNDKSIQVEPIYEEAEIDFENDSEVTIGEIESLIAGS